MICVACNSAEMRASVLCRMAAETGYPLVVESEAVKGMVGDYSLLNLGKEIRILTQYQAFSESEIASEKVIVYDILSLQRSSLIFLRYSKIHAYGIESDYVVDLSSARLRRKLLSLSIYMIVSTVVPTFIFIQNGISLAPIVAQIIFSFFILSLGFLRRKK